MRSAYSGKRGSGKEERRTTKRLVRCRAHSTRTEIERGRNLRIRAVNRLQKLSPTGYLRDDLPDVKLPGEMIELAEHIRRRARLPQFRQTTQSALSA